MSNIRASVRIGKSQKYVKADKMLTYLEKEAVHPHHPTVPPHPPPPLVPPPPTPAHHTPHTPPASQPRPDIAHESSAHYGPPIQQHGWAQALGAGRGKTDVIATRGATGAIPARPRGTSRRIPREVVHVKLEDAVSVVRSAGIDACTETGALGLPSLPRPRLILRLLHGRKQEAPSRYCLSYRELFASILTRIEAIVERRGSG
ncbi:hypothetical protein IW261DRAFT_1612750 [Armillaria novae-zelandiae]|uniref:Uncharacterized protein n=1 Tax=Armillaria novae-zelandiae TaxID=153914 RepID=A0AA39T6X8_9AGAR|nr:hypothetical protein IW261DRAFT_1612750 [Armillaria novae-zelandiae]